MKITRRTSLQLLCGGALPYYFGSLDAQEKELTASFPIGACDWSLKKKQHIEAFDVAKQIGIEGLQVSFSTPKSEYDLRDQKVREQYYRKVDETGVKIASLGMGVLNQKPLSTHPDALSWVSESIDVMSAMAKEAPDKATNICLLAFFGRGDINGKPELMDSVINKLKTIRQKAEDNGVIFGIESLLSADDHLKIIDSVGSKSIQVYYDSANSNRMGYNIYDEVIQIGAERICQVHCKENGNAIGEGAVDFAKFKDSLVKAGYMDWLIIEGSMPKGGKLHEVYKKNLTNLDKIFRQG